MANVFKAKKILGISGLFSEKVLAPNLIYHTGDQTTSGSKTFADNTYFQKNISVSGFYNFDIATTGQPLDGQMTWHPDYDTVQIGMGAGGVINPVGFKSFYRVKAQSTIRKGTVVMAAGAVGGSEYILAQEAQNIGPSGELIMGVSSEEILANNFGDIVAFGPVKGVNTSTFASGNILYYDPLSTGGFTNVIPQAPYAKVLTALTLTQSNNGVIFVRVSAGSELGKTDSNVIFNNLQNNDIIRYSSSGYWYNTGVNFNIFATTGNLDATGITLNNKINTLSGYINSTTSNIVFTTGNQTISGTKTFNSGIVLKSASIATPSTLAEAQGLQFLTLGGPNRDVAIYGSYNGYEKMGIAFKTGNVNLSDTIEFSPTFINASVPLSAPNLIYNTGNQIISGTKTFATGIDIFNGISSQTLRIFNRTGTNTGEFGVIGWQNNNFIVGSQQTQNGVLRDLTLTGANININASGQLNIFDPTNIVGNLTVSGNTTITGHLSAATKSFLIPHPNDRSKKLQYGSLESPYHGIRLTDRAKIADDSVIVKLPNYISSLVNDEKINIQLTNINHSKVLFVKEVNVAENYFVVGIDRKWFDKKEYEFYWSFTAERKDVPQLEVEF